MSDPISFIEKYEADTMYYHQDIKQTHQNKFRELIGKQIRFNTWRKNCKYVPIKDFITGTKTIDAI